MTACLNIPVCTKSPVRRSDIFTDFPFLSLTLELAGKQPPDDGGGWIVVVVVVGPVLE